MNFSYWLWRILDKYLFFSVIRCIYRHSCFFYCIKKNNSRDIHDAYISEKFESTLANKNNIPKVTAVYRVKNAEKFISMSIMSVIPLVDKIIIFDNASTDDTVKVVSNLQKEIADTIEIELFSYPQGLARAGNRYRFELEQDPKKSIAKFYNYCFSKVNTEYALKIDAHCIFNIKGIEKIKKVLAENPDVIYFRGIEFYGKSLSVEPYIFKTNGIAEYIDSERFEICKIKKRSSRKFIKTPVFLHIKRVQYVLSINSSKDPVDSLYSR